MWSPSLQSEIASEFASFHATLEYKVFAAYLDRLDKLREYQATYMRERRKTDAEFRERVNGHKRQWFHKAYADPTKREELKAKARARCKAKRDQKRVIEYKPRESATDEVKRLILESPLDNRTLAAQLGMKYNTLRSLRSRLRGVH